MQENPFLSILSLNSGSGKISFNNIPEEQVCFEVKRKGTAIDVRGLEKLKLSIGMKSAYVVSQLFNDVSGLIMAEDL